MGFCHLRSEGVECSPSCESMAPTLKPDASTCRKNFLSKLGCDNTGAAHILVFNSSKARLCFGSHNHGVAFFVRSRSGRAIFE